MIKVDKGISNGRKAHSRKNTPLMRVLVTLVLMLVVFSIAFIITYVKSKSFFAPPSTYSECASKKTSKIQESYPAVCVTKDGRRFIEPQSEIEKELLESPLKNKNVSTDGKFCGGIAAIPCDLGYRCELDGSYPDAGGKCVLE